jgi:large subunit ribosomal protein L6
MPISVPAGTSFEVTGERYTAKGPKGTVQGALPAGIAVERDGATLQIVRADDSPTTRSYHGLVRALVANAVQGAATGFVKKLDIVGVGYRAEVKGRELHLALGYSHPVIFPMPEGIEITVEKNTALNVSGADRQKVGQVAAELRSLRKPDPYKGKGIKYSGEIVRRKVGKAGGKK